MAVLRLPPGCQFHPTDKELVVEYLRRKVLAWPFPASIIPEVDVCKADPWELPVCKLLAWKEFILNCHYSDWSSSDRLSSGRQKSLEARTALSVLVPFIRLNQRYTDEAGATITWDLVVGGWDLEYSAEFVPNVEGLYIIAVGKRRKLGPSEEAIHNSFTSREAGKMVLSVDNTASRRK